MTGQREAGGGPGMHGAALATGWLAGVGWQLQQPVLTPVAVDALLCAVAALALAVAWALSRARGVRLVRHAASRLGVVTTVVLAAAAFGFGSTAWRASARLADALPAALEGQDLRLVGVVAQLPRPTPQGTRFVFEVEDARDASGPVRVPRRLSLGWYHDDAQGVVPGAAPDLRAGQRWQLTVRLKRTHGLANPHGFDLALWMFEQGIGAGGSVRAAGDNRRLADGVGHPVERLRQRIRDAIERRVADPRIAGVLAALAIGDQAAIDRDDWELFRTTGVAHLMSISGLHVTMFAWMAGALAGVLWRRSTRLALAWPAPVAARWCGLAAAAGYAALAGWGVPAQRTVWMIAAVVALRSAGVRWPMPAVLLAAAVVVTLFDPWAMLQPGFWLSFVAVGLLMVSEPAAASNAQGAPAPAPGRAAAWRAGAWRWLRGGLRTQAVASVGLAPLSLLFFHQVSLVGFAANLVAIPWVTLLVTPLALLGVAVPALWAVAALAVQALVALLQGFATWPYAVWTAAAAPAWAWACGLLAALLVSLRLPWRWRALAAPLLLPLLWPPVARPPEGRFEAVAADVGQGTAVLVRTRRHLLVYDTGPPYGADSDAGGRVLLPLLRARGETAVDLLVLSHRDSDHVGGAASLRAGVAVGALSSSLEEGHPLRAGTTLPHRRCDAGQSWAWDGVRFEMLHPLPGDHARATTRPNALSCVLRVAGANGSLLLTGDIESAQEQALLAREAGAATGAAAAGAAVPGTPAVAAGNRLRSDVLLVPHHGSRTSSTPAFIDAVGPRVAVVQAAYRSRFGHPAPEVAGRYTARGIELVRSDRCGAWTFGADGSTRCERHRRKRYWHHQAAPQASDSTAP